MKHIGWTDEIRRSLGTELRVKESRKLLLKSECEKCVFPSFLVEKPGRNGSSHFSSHIMGSVFQSGPAKHENFKIQYPL